MAGFTSGVRRGGEFSSKRKATTKSGNGDPEVSKKSALER